MNNIKLNPAGIDLPIQRLQTDLYNELLEELGPFGVDEDAYEAFGRIYRNPNSQGGYTPEWYVSKGEYREVLIDDRCTMQSFFGIGERKKVSAAQDIAEVHLIFFINLVKISLADNPYRTDEEARLIIEEILKRDYYGFRFKEIILGPTPIFQEYVLGKRTINETQRLSGKGLSEADLHPWHCFRANLTLRYETD